ncbi:uncharacterized protein J3R85_001402 [Psidium guajava]|nr:uncharacterized protein J3R85_001402 [Psidium guajava]
MGWFSLLFRQKSACCRLGRREGGMDLGAFEVSRKCGCVVCTYHTNVQLVISFLGELNSEKLRSLG